MSAVSWSTIENAIHDWVVLGSGIPPAQIIWGGERAPRPAATPYIVLELQTVRSPGMPWKVRETLPPDPPAHPTDRLLIRKRNHAVARLQLQCFAPDRSSMRLLHDVVSTESAELDAADVGIGEVGEVKLLPGLRSGVFEPRSIVELDLHLSAELTETYEDYIERIKVTVEVDDADGNELAEASAWIPDHPPAPVLVGWGALAAGDVDQAPEWPDAHKVGDWAYLDTQSSVAIAAPAGWTEVASETSGACVHQLFERDTSASGNAEPAPAVAIGASDHLACRIFAVRGLDPEDRIEDIQSANSGGSATDIEWPDATTLDVNRLIVGTLGWAVDDAGPLVSGYTNAELTTGPTEDVDEGTVDGDGGGIAAWSGTAAQPGSIGVTTAVSSAPIEWCAFTVAFKPPD